MHNLKLLLVEDAQEDINTCLSTVHRYRKEKDREIEIIQVSRLSDARKELNNTFDGAIVDLRLDSKDEGNDVINEIRTKYRIPVAVMTGTPQDAQADMPYLGVFTKGETGYDELLDLFCATYDTGITKILGGRGSIEEAMDKVFWKNILPHLGDWKKYNQNNKNTEKALLRFIINHIAEIVDEETGKYFPEEMYISPVISSNIKTGCIVKKKNTDQYYVVLSPACDLALHDGKMKTDQILVCFIDPVKENSLIKGARKNYKIEILETDDAEKKESKHNKMEKAQKTLTQFTTNTYSLYFHYLPKTSLFESGLINFRKIGTYTDEDFKNNFETPPYAQIATTFTKDIISRFSNYYARQGQPDFDFNDLVKTLSE